MNVIFKPVSAPVTIEFTGAEADAIARWFMDVDKDRWLNIGVPDDQIVLQFREAMRGYPVACHSEGVRDVPPFPEPWRPEQGGPT